MLLKLNIPIINIPIQIQTKLGTLYQVLFYMRFIGKY
jgi:hypothetical protein